MLNKKIVAVLLASAFSVPAAAAETGWYGLASFGQTSFKLDSRSTEGSTGTTDKTGTGFKLGAGTMFNRNFGAEAGFVDLGKATFTGSGADTGFDLSVKVSGLFLAGIGSFPVNDQFSVFGKLGLIDASVKATAFGESRKKTSVNMMYGAGVQYDVNKSLGLRAEYEHFDKMGESIDQVSTQFQTGKHSVDMISAGVVFRFK